MADEDAGAAATAESLDAASIQQIGDAAQRLRDTARWTIGAIGGLATALAGALTVTTLEDLENWRFGVGALGLLAIVVGAGWAIYKVGGVLGATDTKLETIEAGPLPNELLTPEMLLGEPSLTQFNTSLLEAEQALVEILVGRPGADVNATAAARSKAAIYVDRAERIRLLAHYYALQDAWRSAKLGMAAGAITVLVGVVGYELAASEQKTAPIRFPHVSDAAELAVDFKTGALGDGVAAKCAVSRRGAVVPSHDIGHEVLLIRPKGGCGGLFVRIAGSQVTTKAIPKPTTQAKVKP